MTLNDVKTALNADVLSGVESMESTVFSACGADLMSDVLAFAREKGVLLTGLINPQVVRTAEMMDIKAIVFVRGKIPTPEIIELANEMGMALLTTEYTLFTSCGILYKNGLMGGE